MLWLIITLLSYFILAGVYLVDKYLLISRIPSPKIYTFYVGILGLLILLVIPFIDFYLPALFQLILSLATGFLFSFSLFWFYKSLSLFEASRIVPVFGALVPLFTFLLTLIFSREPITFFDLLAFFLLVLGTFLISLEKEKRINWSSLKFSSLGALFFAFYMVLSKKVYLQQPFLNGLIWIKIGGFLFSLILFIFSSEVRKSLLKVKKELFPKKTITIFIANQIFGGGATLLQNWAIALAPVIYVPMITALQGVQYAFLLLLVILVSLKFPQILREEISSFMIFQKLIAIILIALGIALLVL